MLQTLQASPVTLNSRLLQLIFIIIITNRHEFRPGWPFRSQHSRRVVDFSVVAQVVVFLWDHIDINVNNM
jgi:hypothetical protein